VGRARRRPATLRLLFWRRDGGPMSREWLNRAMWRLALHAAGLAGGQPTRGSRSAPTRTWCRAPRTGSARRPMRRSAHVPPGRAETRWPARGARWPRACPPRSRPCHGLEGDRARDRRCKIFTFVEVRAVSAGRWPVSPPVISTNSAPHILTNRTGLEHGDGVALVAQHISSSPAVRWP